MTEAPERDVDDILLLKTDQSDAVTQPLVEEFAVSQVIELTERVRPEENERTFS